MARSCLPTSNSNIQLRHSQLSHLVISPAPNTYYRKIVTSSGTIPHHLRSPTSRDSPSSTDADQRSHLTNTNNTDLAVKCGNSDSLSHGTPSHSTNSVSSGKPCDTAPSKSLQEGLQAPVSEVDTSLPTLPGISPPPPGLGASKEPNRLTFESSRTDPPPSVSSNFSSCEEGPGIAAGSPPAEITTVGCDVETELVEMLGENAAESLLTTNDFAGTDNPDSSDIEDMFYKSFMSSDYEDIPDSSSRCWWRGVGGVFVNDSMWVSVVEGVPSIVDERALCGERRETLFQNDGVSVGYRSSNRSDDVVDLVVTGQEVDSVIEGARKLTRVLYTCWRSLPYTHFISLPLLHQHTSSSPPSRTPPHPFQLAVQQFQDKVLQRHFSGLDNPSPFKGVLSLHMTVVMLRLYSSAEIEKCKECLKSVRKKLYDAAKTRSIVLRFRGLGYMGDDPSSVVVLYTMPVGGEEGMKKVVGQVEQQKPIARDAENISRLRDLCDVLLHELVKHDVVSMRELHRQRLLDSTASRSNINLHVTLCNSKFYKPNPNATSQSSRDSTHCSGGNSHKGESNHNTNTSRERGRGRGGRDSRSNFQDQAMQEESARREGKQKRDTQGSDRLHHGCEDRVLMNCTNLLKEFGGIDFGSVKLNEVHLSELNKVERHTGYYRCFLCIRLP
eukprot:GHVQ01025312.1.p2 GENE.GHVQ01025312.1~~GHVQ01025312.1.p2  ORF type:complete len:668 (-),score=101.22 GHVQ01025312.1:2860-4863(-)